MTNFTKWSDLEIKDLLQDELSLKVKADKFSIQLKNLSLKNNKSNDSITHLSQPIKFNKNSDDQEIFDTTSKFKNIFKTKLNINPKNVKHKIEPDDYIKNIILPFIKEAEIEVSKFGRKMRSFFNKMLMLSSISVEYSGKVEYNYIIQIKNSYLVNESSILTIKETSLTGTYSIKNDISGRKINEVGKDDLFHDFLEGYKKYMNQQKGWLKK
ncbi:MAG: hypothetical protein ACK4IX_16990 [Candidatus Sericytochromatia bacterium]